MTALITHFGGEKTDEPKFVCTPNSTQPSKVRGAHLWEKDWKPEGNDNGETVRTVEANSKLDA